MNKNKRTLIRIIIAFVPFAAALVAFNLTPLKSFKQAAEAWAFGDYRFYVYVAPFIAAYIVAGYDVIKKAFRNIFSGRLMDENFLMTVATFGAIALGDFAEACGVMLFYQTGELFQNYAVGRSRKSIAALMDIRPESARVIRGGKEITVSPEEVEAGEILVIRAGERVPVDAVVTEGKGSLDTSSLTGESVPREFSEGDTVLSGSINLTGAVKVRAEKKYEDSTVAKILDLVENASARKAKSENFITKFARYYTPAVVFGALALGVIPPIFVGEWAVWIKRALTFLVVSCPCALVISVPLSFFGGIGGASRQGVLIKGGNYIELLAKKGTFAFDKTGTLTLGTFEVTGVYPEENAAEILRAAAIAESGSLHPIARSVSKYAPETSAEGYTLTEVAGRGVKAEGKGEVLLCGNLDLMKENGVDADGDSYSGTTVYVAKNGVFLGKIVISDKLKDNASDAINSLKKIGSRTVMLTGDNEAVAAEVAKRAGVDEYSAGLLPQDKVARVEEMISAKKAGEAVCFVGDGINDAPVLSVADVGISMGGIGSDAAIEASDVVLMKDDLSSIVSARRIAVKTMRIVKENVIFALGVKAAVLILTAIGITELIGGMWLAVFADVGVAVIAILNAMRTLRAK